MSSLINNTGWMRRAACRDVDPELFFPTADDGAPYEAQAAAAKAVCARCPVRAACLAEALERLPHGVAGGLCEQERRQLRRTGTASADTTGPGSSGGAR